MDILFLITIISPSLSRSVLIRLLIIIIAMTPRQYSFKLVCVLFNHLNHPFTQEVLVHKKAYLIK